MNNLKNRAPGSEQPLSRSRPVDASAACGSDTGQDPNIMEPSIDWSAEIASYIGNLREMMRTSENGFLSVGSKLSEIHAGTRDISEKIAELTEKYSTEEGTDSLEQLRLVSDRSAKQMDSFREYSVKAISHLQDLEAPLGSLPESIREFDRLVSHLRKIGIVAHIEAARIGNDGLDFVRLAETVSLLGEQIALKAKEVRVYVKEVGDVIAVNEKEMKQMIAKHNDVTRTVGGDMESNLRVLDEKHETYRQGATSMSARSDHALNDINAVVQSVQYHDITRQQVEHITEALQSLRLQESVLEVVPICEVQVAQLRRVGEEFTGAILSISTALQDLSTALTMMLSESEQMASYTRESGTTFFEHVERGFETVSATMLEDRAAVRSFTSSLRQISDYIRKMKSFMDEMADVGSEIELLALNSRVKAAKIGDGGETLGVVAEAIQNLSTDTLEQVGEVIAQMSRMVKISADLAEDSGAGEMVKRAEIETNEIIDKLGEVMRAFHLNNEASRELLLETEQNSTAIEHQLELLTEEIKKHGDLGVSLIQTGDMLEQLSGRLRASAPESAQVTIDARLEEIRRSYTMESERVTHGAVLQGNPAEAGTSSGGGDVELF